MIKEVFKVSVAVKILVGHLSRAIVHQLVVPSLSSPFKMSPSVFPSPSPTPSPFAGNKGMLGCFFLFWFRLLSRTSSVLAVDSGASSPGFFFFFGLGDGGREMQCN
ncbi:hypothetical protein Ancab_010300 [Ancistrocladus abbreviatus]